jgi:Ricin-type beta-trefoil lectin domain
MQNFTLKMIVRSLAAIVICSSISFAVRGQNSNSTSQSTRGATTPQLPGSRGTPAEPTGIPQVGCGKCDGSKVYIRNNGGKLCLDADSDTLMKDGGKVQVWGCAPNFPGPQAWSFKETRTEGGRTTSQIVNAGGSKCLDVDKSSINKNGARVQVWKCTGAPEQRWFFRGNELVNEGSGKCLEVDPAGMTKVGAVVRAWDCNKQPPQQWSIVG